jgi:translocation and assembly module TamB
MSINRVLKKTGKVFLYIVGVVLVLLIGAVIFINTNYAKRIIRDKVQSYLQTKLNTKIVIGSIDYSLPKWIEIKNIYVEDQLKDTLFFGEKLSVDLDMIKLIRGITYIRKVELQNIYANISRPEKDSVFNFQFIVDAFKGKATDTIVNTDTSALQLTMKELLLTHVKVRFDDQFGGSGFTANVGNLDATVNKFRPDKLHFDIDEFKADSLDFFMVTYKAGNNSSADTSRGKNALTVLANKFDLKKVNVSVQDKTNGMLYANTVQHLLLNNANVDLANEKAFAKTLLLDSSLVKFVSPKKDAIDISPDSITSSTSWRIDLDELKLFKDQFQFDDNKRIAAKEGVDPAHLDITNINVNANRIIYSADSIVATVKQLALQDKSGFIIDTTHANIFYSSKGITATELYLKTPLSIIQNAVLLKYDDIKQLTTVPQNTSVDIKLNNTVIAVNDLYTLLPSVKKSMPPQKFSGNLVKLNTAISGTLQQLNVPLLQLAGFSGTVINAKAILYNVTGTNNLGYDITVYNSTIPRNDILKFMPQMADSVSSKIPEVLSLSTHVKGNLKNTAAEINVNSHSFYFNGNAVVKNIKTPKRLQYDISINNSRIEKSFIMSMLPKNTIPPSIQLPQLITLAGTLKGDINNIAPNIKLGGSYGTVTAKGYVHNFKNTKNANYDLAFTTNNFQAGNLLKQDTVLGNITMSGTAKGTGFDYKTMHAAIHVSVQEAAVKQYNYHDIIANALLDAGNITSDGHVTDSNLTMQYKATANVSGQYPSAVEATINIDTVQMKKLHLYQEVLNVKTAIYIKAPDLDPEHLNLHAVIDTSTLILKNKTYLLDSTTLDARDSSGNNIVTLRSPIADLNAGGDFAYDKIGPSLLQYINRYYNVTGNSSATPDMGKQQIVFNGTIKKHGLVTDLVPGMTYETFNFKGGYSSDIKDSALSFTSAIPHFTYGSNRMAQAKININTLNDRISGTVNFDTLVVDENIFYKSDINANITRDSISATVVTRDLKDKERYALGATMLQRNEIYTFSLKDTLLLNYQKWNVAHDNSIQYSKQGIIVNNFVVSNNTSKITANSKEKVLNSPVDVRIENFNIRDITSIINSDTLLAAGVINGSFTLSDFNKKIPGFTGNLDVTQFQFMQQPAGDIKLTGNKTDDNTINATLVLTGNGNNVNVKADYYLNNDSRQFDAVADIQQLRMATIQAFSKGNLERSSGSLSGNIALDGKFADPHWKGTLAFDTVKFALAKFGTAYAIDKQKLVLDYPTITLDHFTIKDSTGQPLVVNGTLKSNSLSNYDLALKVNASNFILVNAPKAINNQVYGFAAINTNVTISGNSSSPNIEGDISLTDQTDVTMVLPERNINKDAALSVVRFIDRDTFELPEKKLFRPEKEVKQDVAQFLNYNLNVEISKKAALTIVIDPSTGDALKVQGDAQLNVGVDPGGNIVLVGNYELNSGHYVLTYEFLKKEFDLMPGSTIVFGGSPMDAQVDINAVYTVNTSAKDLLGNEVGEVDAALSNMFNQKIPFKVILNLKGPMKKPNITFDIQLPDENTQINQQLRTTIENKLVQLRGDIAATNKQVFSLLLLNRFAGEQSSDFFKGNGSSFDDLARESVSKFLSSALDQIASDLFKGVDIDLNLNSYKDYNSGDAQQRTDLNIAVTKRFLDDRLSISVGSNFGIEGNDASAKASQQKGNGYVPDVTVSYKLTKDGKYMVKAYKKNQFEVILDGYVVETGVAFIVSMDYDKFRELFKKKSKINK